MLTDKGDLVLDPFAGSCVTGEVAEVIGRTWICCELSEEYLKGARVRFVGLKPKLRNQENQAYQIYPPCSMNGKIGTSPLPSDGGLKRPPAARTEEESEAACLPGRAGGDGQ